MLRGSKSDVRGCDDDNVDAMGFYALWLEVRRFKGHAGLTF